VLVPGDPLRLLPLALQIMWEALHNATMVVDIKLSHGVSFYFFFFNFGLDVKWTLNGYMGMKRQATSFLHLYSSRKTFHRKGHKKVVRLGLRRKQDCAFAGLEYGSPTGHEVQHWKYLSL